MAIDKCQNTFSELASKILPQYMEQLNSAWQHSVSDFAVIGVGTRSLIKSHSPNSTTDFKGIYVFHEDKSPVYVGISRKVITRIRQHITGRSHFDASLAFKMASKALGINGKRDELMENPLFLKLFVEMKERLRLMKVSFVQVENDVELYLLEVYASMHYDTSIWNTFKTH